MDKEAYKLGQKSYVRNRGKYINPYPRSDSRHNDFERGWSQAIKKLPDTVIKEIARQTLREEEYKLELEKKEKERVKKGYLDKKG